MIVLYVLYGLLIVTAIVFIPLRIRSRRQILREINSLRLNYNQDMSQLFRIIEGEVGTEPKEVEQPKPNIIWKHRPLDTFNNEMKPVHAGAILSVCGRLGEFEESKEVNWQRLWGYSEERDTWMRRIEVTLARYGAEANVIRIIKGRPESSGTPFCLSHKCRWTSIDSELAKSSYTSNMHRNRLLEPAP